MMMVSGEKLMKLRQHILLCHFIHHKHHNVTRHYIHHSAVSV